MKQSQRAPNKLPRWNEGRHFFLATLRKIDTGLPALVVALCSNRSKLNVQIQIRCHEKIIESFAFPVD